VLHQPRDLLRTDHADRAVVTRRLQVQGYEPGEVDGIRRVPCETAVGIVAVEVEPGIERCGLDLEVEQLSLPQRFLLSIIVFSCVAAAYKKHNPRISIESTRNAALNRKSPPLDHCAPDTRSFEYGCSH